MKLSNLNVSLLVDDLPQDLVLEIQECLVKGGYLKKEQIDGIVGMQTKQAIAIFKHDSWLGEPEFVGSTTAKALLELSTRHSGTIEAQTRVEPLPDGVCGSKTGNTMQLPDGKVVYANELMLPRILLTWGETTKNCTRVPTENYEIVNALRLAKAFGEVRERFGSPLSITSGFRPSAVNRVCGGVSNSQHIPFKALDMLPINGDYYKLWQVLKSSSFAGLGDGVSTGKGFYHADIRESGRIIFGY